MPPARTLAALFTLLALTASAQTADPVARVFHPPAPLPSYDVATIKPFNPAPAPNGMARALGNTIRVYIRGAYAPSTGPLPAIQVVGGPDWLDKDRYTIEGKPPAGLEVAMQQMNLADRTQQNHAMQQSLLADRFHLKVHFEVREMPVYALVPAKSGLKIKAVADPTPPAPDGPQSQPSSAQKPARPVMLGIQMKGADRIRTMRAHAISMARLAGILGPMINQTGRHRPPRHRPDRLHRLLRHRRAEVGATDRRSRLIQCLRRALTRHRARRIPRHQARRHQRPRRGRRHRLHRPPLRQLALKPRLASHPDRYNGAVSVWLSPLRPHPPS